MFEATVRDGALRVRAPGARWLRTGPGGGYASADATYNLTVPEGFDRTDLDAYAAERRRRADFDEPGPSLLTGVDQANARGARSGDVVVYATVGLSNPAALPVPPGGAAGGRPRGEEAGHERPTGSPRRDGTVNLLVGTTRALEAGALAALLGVAVEAKTATLLAESGFPGTTSDAAVVGCRPDGEPAVFTGSGTPVGAATRACVREAVSASLEARYPGGGFPGSVAAADHGTRTDRVAEVFDP